MQEYKDLTKEEKRTVYDLAEAWISNHGDYVTRLIRSARHRVPPSGSDMFRPELWKSIHWYWFDSIRYMMKEKIELKSVAGKTPFNTLDAVERVSNQWIEPMSALHMSPALMEIWKLTTDELIINGISWTNEKYYTKFKGVYDARRKQ